MSFFDQALSLLSQPPGSLIYHLGVLFAIQAALGIAMGYRKRPAVRRVALAAGGMLAVRLALMIVALLDSRQLVTNSPAILPPLERAVDAIGIWLLIWAFLPLFNRMPQWGDLLAGCVALLLLVVYIFFAVAWYSDPAPATAYNNSYQDAVWEAIQLGLLAAGCGYLLLSREGDWILQLGVLAIMLGGHVGHYGWAADGESVAAWVRLGQLAAYPLFTVGTYRLVVGQLLERVVQPPLEPLPDLVEPIKRVTAVTSTTSEAALTKAAVTAVAQLAGADVVSLLLVVEQAERMELEQVAVYSHGHLSPGPPAPFGLDESPTLRRAINQKQPFLLRPEGIDDLSRLSLLVQLMPEISLETRLRSSLLIQPVAEDSYLFGALLVAIKPDEKESEWPAGNRQLVDLLANHLAATLSQTRVYRRMKKQVSELGSQVGKLDPETAGRLEQLRTELSEARRSERQLARNLDSTQQELARAQRRTEDLAVLLDGQTGPSEEVTVLASLNDEQEATIAKLRQRIESLAAELESQPMADNGREAEDKNAVVVRPGQESDSAAVGQVVEELRKPIASLVGYADLLLGESLGSVGDLQRVFLQRVKASSERAQVMLKDLEQVADAGGELIKLNLEAVDVAKMVENALTEFDDQIEKQSLNLEVDIQRSLPRLEVDRSVLDQIFYHLLSNAFRVTLAEGTVLLEVRFQDSEHIMDGDEPGRPSGYLFVSLSDSGAGMSLDKQPHVFDRSYRTEHAQLPGVADGGLGLPLVSELVKAHGGRIWVESEEGTGSTFSLVLPASLAAEQETQ